MKPYYADETVTLYLGDCREVVPALGLRADCLVVDPPYGETTLEWDRWPDGWPAVAAGVASSMWCFGSMRMFLERRDEFTDWKLSQDVVWEKHTGSSFATDRFKRVHEHALHWYRGPWGQIYRDTPRVPYVGPRKTVKNRAPTPHTGAMSGGTYNDDGTRLIRSVVKVSSMHGRAIHPTEKPVPLLLPLIEYACPPGGLVADLQAGSGSVGEAARMSGRRAVLIEADERYCEAIANRLQQDVLPLAVTR